MGLHDVAGLVVLLRENLAVGGYGTVVGIELVIAEVRMDCNVAQKIDRRLLLTKARFVTLKVEERLAGSVGVLVDSRLGEVRLVVFLAVVLAVGSVRNFG